MPEDNQNPGSGSTPTQPVVVNRDTCIGCGICTSIAPDVFSMDEEGKSVVTDPTGANAQDAADACPVGAITITQ